MKRRKILLLGLSGLGMLALGVKSLPNNVYSVKAEEIVDVEPETDTEVVEIDRTNEEVSNKLQNFLDTFLTPILLGLGSIDIGAVLYFSITTFIKRRKEKERDQKFENATAQFAELTTQISSYLVSLKDQKAILDNEFNKVYTMADNSLKLLQDTSKNCESVGAMKAAIILLAEVIALIQQHDKNAIADGSGAKLKELLTLLEQIK